MQSKDSVHVRVELDFIYTCSTETQKKSQSDEMRIVTATTWHEGKQLGKHSAVVSDDVSRQEGCGFVSTGTL